MGALIVLLFIPVLILALPPFQAWLMARRLSLRNNGTFTSLGTFVVYLSWGATLVLAYNIAGDGNDTITMVTAEQSGSAGTPTFVWIALGAAIYAAVNHGILLAFRRALARSSR